MTTRPNRRLSLIEIDADRAMLVAVKGLGNYAPMNPAYSIAAVSELETALERARQEETRVLAVMLRNR